MPLFLLTENQETFILYRFQENYLPFCTVNPVTGLWLLTLPMHQVFYKWPAKTYWSKYRACHLKHIKRERSTVRKVIRSAASFPPQYNNERKCYPLYLIQFPLKSRENSNLLQWKLHQALSEEKPADLNQRAKQSHTSVMLSCKSCVHIRCCIILQQVCKQSL